MWIAVVLALLLTLSGEASAWPRQETGSAVVKDMAFSDGRTVPALKLGYMTIGTPERDESGEIRNAVLLLHGTSGTHLDWLRPELADPLFSAGAPLDASKFYVIVPDGIGRGGSAKPSDGAGADFPHYRYADMVSAQYRLLTEVLGIRHLRLVMGVSMGGMHSWMWAQRHPTFMDGVVPIASQPGRMSGRNWIFRKIVIDAIRNDPAWNQGRYAQQPTLWRTAALVGPMMTESVVRLQEMAPAIADGDRLLKGWAERLSKIDTNDALWAAEAVEDYDPSLAAVSAPVLAINFTDDEVNPIALDNVAPAVSRIAGGRTVIVPASDRSRGHFSYFDSRSWSEELRRFIDALPRRSEAPPQPGR